MRWEKVADGVATGGFNGKIRVSKASGEVIARPPVLSVPRKVTQGKSATIYCTVKMILHLSRIYFADEPCYVTRLRPFRTRLV